MSLTLWLANRLCSRATSQSENRLQSEVDRLNSDLANTREQLEKERVTVRIQQVEIKLLAAVHARDLDRWQLEHPPGVTDHER